MSTPWHLAHRAERMNPSVIREILKLAGKPGLLSMAGGLPSADTFPVDELKAACDRVLTDAPAEALQYAASEGYAPLREWVAERVGRLGLQVSPDQVLVTNGSQQGLDLMGKVMIDEGAPVAVETPTYLGALQAFTPYEPRYVSLDSDEEGVRAEAMAALRQTAPAPRFAYLLPNYQNPTGRVMSLARRQAVMAAAQDVGVPVIEDNPYGDLWYDAEPLPSLASMWPGGTVYLGSFSKILTPGFRLGFIVAPQVLFPKLLQAKQAADLHTPGFNQRVVHEVIKNGFLDAHIPRIRARYKANRDAMAAALRQHLPAGSQWQSPQGGMFFWVRLPEGLNAVALLDKAVAAGIAYVPGAPFYAAEPDPRALRLSFVTLTPAQIEQGVATLGRVLREAQG